MWSKAFHSIANTNHVSGEIGARNHVALYGKWVFTGGYCNIAVVE